MDPKARGDHGPSRIDSGVSRHREPSVVIDSGSRSEVRELSATSVSKGTPSWALTGISTPHRGMRRSGAETPRGPDGGRAARGSGRRPECRGRVPDADPDRLEKPRSRRVHRRSTPQEAPRHDASAGLGLSRRRSSLPHARAGEATGPSMARRPRTPTAAPVQSLVALLDRRRGRQPRCGASMGTLPIGRACSDKSAPCRPRPTPGGRTSGAT